VSVARRKGMLAVVVLQLVLLAAPLVAQEGVEQLFPAQPTGYLTDVAGVVDPASAARIEEIAKTLREKTGAELAVVTLPTIGRFEASDVALVIGRRWGVGAKASVGDKIRNAGVVMLLVPRREGQPGKIRLEVGDGLQGVLTDATSGRIRDAMRPQLAAGEYGPGLVTGVETVAALVAKDLGVRDSTLVPPQSAVAPGSGPPMFLVLLLIFVFLAIIRALASSARAGGTRGRRPRVYWGPGIGGGGWGGGGGFGGGGGGFGGFGGGGGFSGGGAGGDF
jgi:uncharacterized protein